MDGAYEPHIFFYLSYMRRYAVCIAIARLMANVFFINNYFLQRFSFLTTIVKCVCVCALDSFQGRGSFARYETLGVFVFLFDSLLIMNLLVDFLVEVNLNVVILMK